MRQGELDKLLSDAQVERNDKIRRANRDYAEAIKHIRWLKLKLKVRTAAKNAVEEVPEKPAEEASDSSLTLAAGVRAAAEQASTFTADTVATWLSENHPTLDAPERREAIAIILSRLVKQGMAEVVERGVRGKAQVYRKTARFKEVA